MNRLLLRNNKVLIPSILTQILICEVWGIRLLSYSKAVALRLPFMDVFAPIIVPSIILLTAIASFSYWSKFIRGTDWLFVFGFASLFVISWGLLPENKMYEEYWAVFLFTALPTYLIGVLFDIKGLEKVFFVISLLTVLLQGVNSLVFEQAEINSMSDSELLEQMNTSYGVLPHALYLFYYFFKHLSVKTLFCAVLSLLLLLSYGTRGPVVCTVFFIASYVFLSVKSKYRFWIIVVIGIAGYFLITNLMSVALFMSEITNQLGMSDRIFKLVLEEDYTHTSGRDDMLSQGFSALQSAPIFGYGLGGSWVTLKGYSHNLALDILTSFGFFVGSIILFAFAFMFFITYLRVRKDTDKLPIFLLLFSCGFVKFFMSAYALGDLYFFLLIGYCVGRLRGVTLPIRNNNALPQTTVN